VQETNIELIIFYESVFPQNLMNLEINEFETELSAAFEVFMIYVFSGVRVIPADEILFFR
jgi:hypothetical protein